jgi:hypothetical protein
MSFETLYKTDVPQEMEAAEYFRPHLDMEFINGAWVFFVREKHGWYDDATKRAIHHMTTLSPEEGSTSKEAEARYNQQVQFRAKEGYTHSFSIDPFSPSGMQYRKIPLEEI